MQKIPEISEQNIEEWLTKLNTYNSTPEEGAGTTRLVFSKEEVEARNYIKSIMKEVGLKIEEDAIGNIFGVLEGEDPSLAPVWSGSHIDTVLHAGMFDGMTGVIAAIEALRSIKDSGVKLKRNLKAIVFTSEEPTRFKKGCLGSRAMAGELDLEECKKLTDSNSMTLYKQMMDLGYKEEEFQSIKKSKGDVHAMVELHIEQAEHLEKNKLQVGIVKAITAYRAMVFHLKGKQDHAGGTRMSIRKDAVCAMAEIITAIEKFAKETGRLETVATVGKIDVYPNALNIISGDVSFTLDLREDDREVQLEVIDKIIDFAEKIVNERGITMTYETVYDDLPAIASEHILSIITENCQKNNVTYQYTRSGAGHDSQLVSRFAPFAMIFIPCREGISHNPEEFAKYEDIVNGTKVLRDTLSMLANEEGEI